MFNVETDNLEDFIEDYDVYAQLVFNRHGKFKFIIRDGIEGDLITETDHVFNTVHEVTGYLMAHGFGESNIEYPEFG